MADTTSRLPLVRATTPRAAATPVETVDPVKAGEDMQATLVWWTAILKGIETIPDEAVKARAALGVQILVKRDLETVLAGITRHDATNLLRAFAGAFGDLMHHSDIEAFAELTHLLWATSERNKGTKPG